MAPGERRGDGVGGNQTGAQLLPPRLVGVSVQLTSLQEKEAKIGCQTCSREGHREGTECPGKLSDKCFICEKPGHFEGAPVCSGIKPVKIGTDDAPVAQDLHKHKKTKKKKEKRKGAWVARLQLQPGKYLYKFVVDGNWLVNPGLTVVGGWVVVEVVVGVVVGMVTPPCCG